MNDAVIPELELLAFSVLSGALCFFGYDLLLVLRIFFKRAVILEKAEDILYWLAASVLVFSVIYEKNSGIIRGYSIAGMLAGMLFYRGAAKERLTQAAQKRSDRIKNWFRRKIEPIQKKKRELQNKRKQSKIEKKEQRRGRRQEKKEKAKREANKRKAEKRKAEEREAEKGKTGEGKASKKKAENREAEKRKAEKRKAPKKKAEKKG